MTERWLPAPGWEGFYEVSDQGRVRSLDRIDPIGRAWKGRVLVLTFTPYAVVGLCRDGTKTHVSVHVLVVSAFLGPRPAGMQVRHLDGNPLNNHATNLRWGTPSENTLDAVAHGTNINTRKTHCPSGHEYSPENTQRLRGGRRRRCRECARAQGRKHYRTNRIRVLQGQRDAYAERRNAREAGAA